MKEHLRKALNELKDAQLAAAAEISYVEDQMNKLLEDGMHTDDPKKVEDMANMFDALNNRLIEIRISEREMQNVRFLIERVRV